jgi:hypothetical protein
MDHCLLHGQQQELQVQVEEGVQQIVRALFVEFVADKECGEFVGFPEHDCHVPVSGQQYTYAEGCLEVFQAF